MPDYDFMDISKLLHCGVYCLLRKGEVVYVGKSKKPLVRLYTHVYNRGKEAGRALYPGIVAGPTHGGKGINFDGIWFVPCMLGQLDVIELAMIRKYEPRYNVRGKPPTPIPDEIKALLKQMVVITSLPPQDDTFQRFIPRRL